MSMILLTLPLKRSLKALCCKSAPDARVWDAEQINPQALVLRYVSAYYEEGFPGELSMTVMFTLTNDNEIVIDYRGTTNKKTVVNMTHHGFFSLEGIANPTPTCEDTICYIHSAGWQQA